MEGWIYVSELFALQYISEKTYRIWRFQILLKKGTLFILLVIGNLQWKEWA